MSSEPNQADPPVPSAAGGPHEAKRKTAEELAAEQGVKPIEDFGAFIDEFRDVWPQEQEIDEFLIWLRKIRNEGRERS